MNEKVDWATVTEKSDPHRTVSALHDVFSKATEESYQLNTTTRKSTQPQWINQNVLELIQQRRAVFRREGRSEVWKKLKKKTRSIIKRRKAFFNKKKREKMLASDSKSFHKCVKSTINDEKTKHWSLMSMFPSLEMRRLF